MALLAAGALGLAFYLKRPSPEFRALQVRAVKIFEFDRSHPGALDPAQVRALGVAVGFHDERGVRTLVAQLEHEMAGVPVTGSDIPRMK
jgi:hypothetical protein